MKKAEAKSQVVISDKAKNRINKDNILMAKLMIQFDRGQFTIESWIKNDDIRLTTPAAIDIITEHTGLKRSEVI